MTDMIKVKTSRPGAIKTSIHETHHVFASACAAVKLGIPEGIYSRARAHTHVDGEFGEAAVYFGDDLPMEVQAKIAALGASGPVANMPAENLTKALRSMDISKMSEVGDLSEKDVELLASWDGPETTPALIVLATRELRDLLGPTKFQAFAKLVRDITNTRTEGEFTLKDLVPYEAAQTAVDRAQSRLSQIMEGG